MACLQNLEVNIFYLSEPTGTSHAATEGGAVLLQDVAQLGGVAHQRQRVEGAAAVRGRIRPLGLVPHDARLHLELARAGGVALLVLALEAEANRVGGPLDSERATLDWSATVTARDGKQLHATPRLTQK